MDSSHQKLHWHGPLDYNSGPYFKFAVYALLTSVGLWSATGSSDLR